jgi:Hydrazine synthase alpha subunit middle domain
VTPRFVLIPIISAGLLALCALVVPRTPVAASLVADSPSLLYTVTMHYEPLAWMRGADRFKSGATIFLRDAQGKQPLVPSFAASADPAVSFDGQRVLFAGKRAAEDSWQIWEIALAGGEPRRITSGAEDCVRPFYLPEDRVVYARRIAGRFVIETVDLAGGRPWALTYGPANYLPSDVLRDGRILFEAAYPLGADAVPEIYTVYSDGSGVESYRCDHGTARHSARQVHSGDIVFASAHGLARFTSAKAHEVGVSAPAGEYAGEVVETATGDWLLPWRADTRGSYRLMRRTPGSSTLRPIVAESDADAVQPVLVAERAAPNRHPSGLHDWPNANLLCLNAYTSKSPFVPGSIHSVRLYTKEGDGDSKLLGTAPVERDGSFFVQVPTEQPLQIELLDAAGKTLRRESGFFWMRRGEQRGCVGCHAGPETSPENAVPMILLKSTTPADLTGATAQSASGGH